MAIPLGPKHQPKTPKFKIEFNDNSGAKYSFSIEGALSKESMVKMADFVNELSSTQDTIHENPRSDYSNIDTNFSRVYGLLQTKFRFGSFASSDVLEAYEQEFDTQTTLSTISTYLSRLTDRGLLTRFRNGSGWSYKLIKLVPQEPQEQTLNSNEQNTPSPNLLTP